MRILMVSNDFSDASLARRLVLEGHDVRAFVADPACERIMLGLVGRVATLDAGLDWVGRDGLVVVDDTGFGEWQDQARAEEFAVAGGSALGDRLEHDRAWAMDVLAAHGIATLPTVRFPDCAAAAAHVRTEPRAWAVKFNRRAPKAATFIGHLPCGSDAADFLDLCARRCNDSCDHCGTVLQPVLDGIEIGVARYFDGRQWAGPVELNIEHKRFLDGNLGPNTFEMGTLLWYMPQHPLFDRLLAPLEPLLAEAGHVGDLDISCLATDQGIFPLEVTARFGWPATQAQMALHTTPWAEFLQALARQRQLPPGWRPGFAVAILIATPPFPFAPLPDPRGSSYRGLPVRFRRPLTADEALRVHYESVEFSMPQNGHPPVLCDDSGYALHVTGHGPSVAAARQQAYNLARLVALPGAYYRTDIGVHATESIRRVEKVLPQSVPIPHYE